MRLGMVEHKQNDNKVAGLTDSYRDSSERCRDGDASSVNFAMSKLQQRIGVRHAGIWSQQVHACRRSELSHATSTVRAPGLRYV